MKIRAAVLDEMGRPGPYAQSRPVAIETIELDAPGPDQVRERAFDRRRGAVDVAELDRAVELEDQLGDSGLARGVHAP